MASPVFAIRDRACHARLSDMRIAGIDYGTVRIGIALADTEVGIASPFENYNRRATALDAEYFRRLATEERIGRFVVGLPVHLSGDESQKSFEARAFGQWLGEATQLPVEYFDERFTTSEADELLGAAKLTKKQRQARRDQLAAQIMLTAYLEAGGRGQDALRGIE
jgi:putative Holliday junction resolvase